MVRATVTAKYPGAELVDADVGIASNIVQQILSAAVTAGAVVWTFTSTTGFEADMFLRVRSSTGFEVVRVVSVDSSTQITVLRAQDGTTAVGHAANTAAECVVIALGHNQVVAEVKALEDALIGGGFLHDVVISSDDATSGDTLKDSYALRLRAHYWNVSNQTYDVRLWHDMNAVTPESFFKVDIGGTTRLALRASDGEMRVDAIKALTTNSALVLGFNGTGDIKIGTGVTAGAGTVAIGPAGSSDAITVAAGTATGLDVFMTSASRFRVTASLVGTGATPFTLYSDAFATEQSRFTAAAGSTTWLAALASDIVIKATTGGIVIGGVAAADGVNYLSSPDGTDYFEARDAGASLVSNSVYRLRALDVGVGIYNATPLIWYAGNGTDERFRLASPASNQFTLTADETGVFVFINEATVPVFGVGVIQPSIPDSNLQFRLNAPTAGTGSFTMGQISSLPSTFRIGDTTQYLQLPLENPGTAMEVVGTVSGVMLKIQDGTNGGIETNFIRAVTTNANLAIQFNGSGGIMVGGGTPTAGEARMQSTVAIGFVATSTSANITSSSGNIFVADGPVIKILLGQLSLRGPFVLFSDTGTTEQSRFTIAVGSTTWAAASGSDILIKNDQAVNVFNADSGATGGLVIGDGSAPIASTTIIQQAGAAFGTGNQIVIGENDIAFATRSFAGTLRLVNGNFQISRLTNGMLFSVYNGTAGVNPQFQVANAATSINAAQAPLILYSDYLTTEQSRFTTAAGSTAWAAVSASNIVISIIAGATMGIGVGNNLNYSISHTNEWAFTGTLRVATIQAQGTNTDFALNFNGSGGIAIGAPGAAANELRLGSVSTDYLRFSSPGDMYIVQGSVNNMFFNTTTTQFRNALPAVFYSDDGSNEEGRITASANLLVMKATASAVLELHNDQNNVAIAVGAGANGVVFIKSDGVGDAALRSSDSDDGFITNTTNTRILRNNVELLTIIDAEFAHTNLATAEVVFHNTTASERWRLSPTQLTGQLADPGDGLAAASASIVLVAKNDPTGGPAQADYDFLMQHVVSSGAGGATPVLDAVFKLVGTTGFTIRKRIGDTGDYAVPLVPNLDTTNIAAAVYPGAIVRDTFNQAGSGMFFSDGTNWYELDIID